MVVVVEEGDSCGGIDTQRRARVRWHSRPDIQDHGIIAPYLSDAINGCFHLEQDTNYRWGVGRWGLVSWRGAKRQIPGRCSTASRITSSPNQFPPATLEWRSQASSRPAMWEEPVALGRFLLADSASSIGTTMQ